jgi:predicted outer membrane repeat protein
MKTGKKLKLWMVVFVILFVAAGAFGKVYYVDADAPGSTLGTSWETAFVYLEDALWFARDGDEIRMAQGVYKPDGPGGDRTASFNIDYAVKLEGGYAGYGEPNPDERNVDTYKTILSGDLNGNDVEVTRPQDLLEESTRADNSYHVVNVYLYYNNDSEPVLDGFTITGGNADGAYRDNQGGGMYMYYSKVRITDCKFINNKAGYGTMGDGGAMAFQNSRVIFKRCLFIRNTAGKDGGAVHMDGCGTCNDSYAEFKDCRFINNYARNDGGALFNTSNTLTNLLNCIIAGNFAGGYGGGVLHSTYSPYTTSLANCTLTGNWARYGGGAVHDDQQYYYTSNSALLNCIVWDNKQTEVGGSTSDVDYSDVKGGWPGTGNIEADPLFVQPGYWADIDDLSVVVEPYDEGAVWVDGDYHLQPGSPCIDTGDPAYIATQSGDSIPVVYYFDNPLDYVAKTSEMDLDGQLRVVGGKVDMGAYEYSVVISAEAGITPGNINLSGNGKWITCRIWLPEEYEVAEIDPGSIRLEDSIRPLWMWFDEAKQVAMVKFKLSEVQQLLEPGDMELAVTGRLDSGISFEAVVYIKVLGKDKDS